MSSFAGALTLSSQWRKGVTCKDHAQWWDSNVVEYNRRWSSFTNLTVPFNEDGLLVLVEGGVYGSVDFVEDHSLANEAYVDFYVEYDYRVFQKTDICSLENAHDNGSGVGIFVSVLSSLLVFLLVGVVSCVLIFCFRDGFQAPKHLGGRKAIMARITVHLPEFETAKMKKMTVIAPDMEVNFPSGFKSKILSVASKTAPLHVTVSSSMSPQQNVGCPYISFRSQNVECEFCNFHVSDGPISGNFTVKSELILKTKSGTIDADITMISGNTTRPPNVDITTTTGSINANFTLIAVDPETEEKLQSGGAYKIATRSLHAPVRLQVMDAPVDSTLILSSKNTRGPMDVHLHPTFQGRFSSEAIIGDTPLGFVGHSENPSGSSRRRNLVWNGWSIPPGICHVMKGEVWWGDRPEFPSSYDPSDLFFSSVQVKSIIGQPLIYLHLSDPSATSTSVS